ncbi:Uncharacterised protein [Vibrio cholerae]|nr:Uncharacterised protein [Vibrio cholerae]
MKPSSIAVLKALQTASATNREPLAERTSMG